MAFWNTVMDAQGDVPSGKRLIPLVIDEIATKNPERVCFAFPRTTNLQDGFRDLNFRTFANAINKTAHFIQQEIGRSSMFETVMYMGYPDVRYYIVIVALMKTGHKVLFSSHRNSVAAHANLIKRTDCTILLHTEGFPVSGIIEACRMESLCMPDLDYLLNDLPCEHFPYEKTFDEGKNHPVMVVHTSGSTGLPKPVVWTHWTLITGDPYHHVPPLDNRPTLWGGIFDSCRRAYMALPIFHGAGIGMGIAAPCFSQTVTVLGPPGLATAEVLNAILDSGNIDAVNALPGTLEDVATRADVLSRLDSLKFIAVVDGALSNDASEKISQYAQTHTLMPRTDPTPRGQHETDPLD